MPGIAPIWLWTCLVLAAPAVNGQPVVDDGFDGINEVDAGAGSLPADPDLAIGSDLVVQVVNRWMRMWARDGNGNWTVVGNADLTDFLDINGLVSPATDPRIIRDPETTRFIVSLFGESETGEIRNVVLRISSAESSLKAAVDQESDPFDSSLWSDPIDLQGLFPQDDDALHPVVSECATGNNLITGALGVDQPALGLYADAILVAADLGGQDSRDNVFWFISREPDQQGEFQVAGPAFGSDFVLPAGTLGCAPGQGFGHEKAMPIKGSEDYDHALFVGVDWTPQTQTCENAGKLDSFILYAFMDPFDDLSDRRIARVTVSCFASGDCVETEGEGGMDPETELPLDGYDTRVQSAQVTVEGESEFLWITQSIGAAGTFNKPICRWYKIDLNGWPASGTATPFVDTSGTVGPPPFPPPPSVDPEMGRLYPAGIVDPSTGTLGVVFARSAPGETTSVRAWGRLANGTIFSPDVAIQNPVGDTPDLGATCVRWGDYSDVELDPDDGSFWATGMYMKEGGEDPELWGTWIFTVD